MTVKEIFQKTFPFYLSTDSKSLYDAIVGIGATTENRLLEALSVLRQLYEVREISEVVWILSAQNLADALAI